MRKYLAKIMHLSSVDKHQKKLRDNYLFHNYLFSFKIVDGIKSFSIYWGITNFNNIITDNYQNTI